MSVGGTSSNTRLIGELGRPLMHVQPDEAQLSARIQALHHVDLRVGDDARKEYEEIDQVLNVRQRATFRVFEEQMERRKLEIVTRARQRNRANQQQ